MDPHLNEYLGAVAGMLECYGKPSSDNSCEDDLCSPTTSSRQSNWNARN